MAPVAHTDRGESSVAGELGRDEFGQVDVGAKQQRVHGGGYDQQQWAEHRRVDRPAAADHPRDEHVRDARVEHPLVTWNTTGLYRVDTGQDRSATGTGFWLITAPSRRRSEAAGPI